MKYTYLLIDFFTILVPFLFSFHPRLQFYKTWKAFFPAVILTGLLFVLWDAYFTRLGVWGFNPTYLIGVYIGNLPLEEILFFFCIPYACVFTYYCLERVLKGKITPRAGSWLTWILILLAVAVIVLAYGKLYTCTAFFLLIVLLMLSKYLFRISWLPDFYLIYGILLVPFLVVNGLLTGTGLDAPVVWYNGHHILGLRLLTIPVEDIFYGMDLVLMNLLIYKAFRSRTDH